MKIKVDLGAEAEAARYRRPLSEDRVFAVRAEPDGKLYLHGFTYDVDEMTAPKLMKAAEDYRTAQR